MGPGSGVTRAFELEKAAGLEHEPVRAGLNHRLLLVRDRSVPVETAAGAVSHAERGIIP